MPESKPNVVARIDEDYRLVLDRVNKEKDKRKIEIAMAALRALKGIVGSEDEISKIMNAFVQAKETSSRCRKEMQGIYESDSRIEENADDMFYPDLFPIVATALAVEITGYHDDEEWPEDWPASTVLGDAINAFAAIVVALNGACDMSAALDGELFGESYIELVSSLINKARHVI